MFQGATYKEILSGLTAHVTTNVSCYMCAAGNPESGVGKGAGQTRVKTR